MRFTKAGHIKCSEHLMVKILRIADGDATSNKFQNLLTPEGEQPRLGPDQFVFRSGAKLGRLGKSTWYIHSYVPDGVDGRAALYELKSADFVRRAIDMADAVDVALGTRPEYKPKLKGLWGHYPDRKRFPYTLN